MKPQPSVSQTQQPQSSPGSAEESPLSQEDVEMIAHLDELENMELICNYDNLQELDPALLSAQGESAQ